MSSGSVVAALTGVPAGRLVNRFGASVATLAGLALMGTGCVTLSLVGASFGVPGYVGPLVAVTSGYALFQTANTTALLRNVCLDQRGVVSGLLNLSRNLGLITGASAMGTVFALASSTGGSVPVSASSIATGMQVTFAVATALTVAALTLSWGARATTAPANHP